MANICLFNPWHDIALAYGRKPFTPPRIAVRMFEQLGDIATLWDDEDGYVLPWGWDHYTKRWLVKRGFGAERMPADDDIDRLRELSNRKTSVVLLEELRTVQGTVGEAHYVTDAERIEVGMVVKALWSSSGRGVRVYAADDADWVKNVIRRQGGIMLEPCYDKVKDFAMEFVWNGQTVEYLGLSLFRNAGGRSAYDGNVVASEERKMQMLSEYVRCGILEGIREKIVENMSKILRGLPIVTPFGVDMMIIMTDRGVMVHPCVEVNLRRTMGYVALKIYERCVNKKLKFDIDYEKDSVAFFSVDAAGGKWTVCKSGVESGQW